MQRNDYMRKWDRESAYRTKQALQGRTRDSPKILSCPPWTPKEWNDDPPEGDDEVLNVLKNTGAYENRVGMQCRCICIPTAIPFSRI